jgi:hypothetical protein
MTVLEQRKGRGRHPGRRRRRVAGGAAHCRRPRAARHESVLKAFSNLLKARRAGAP